VFDEVCEVDVRASICRIGDDAHDAEWEIGGAADLSHGCRLHIDTAGGGEGIQQTLAFLTTREELIASCDEAFKKTSPFETWRIRGSKHCASSRSEEMAQRKLRLDE